MSLASLDPVSRTMLIPLWARATETRKRRPLVRDEMAREICDRIDFDFGVFRHSYGSQLGCVLRGLLYDEWVGRFLNEHPTGTIVELGAGLSTRFERIDNGSARWVDVDLPEAIALRRAHVSPSARRRFVEASIADRGWTRAVSQAGEPPWCFVCEGTLMYVEPDLVRSFFVDMADSFGPTRIAFDSIAPAVVRHQNLHDAARHMMDAPFRWGILDVREIALWDRRLHVEDVATLSDVARRFERRVRRRHRLAGALLTAALPSFVSSYRLSLVNVGR